LDEAFHKGIMELLAKLTDDGEGLLKFLRFLCSITVEI
jgi:hypothetical protein